MRFRAPLVLFLAFSACKGGGGKDVPPGQAFREVEVPKEWESNDAAVVMRLTNAGSSSDEVKIALNAIFNDPEEPIDGLDFLMRSPQRDADGNFLPVDGALTTAELLAGSTLEQITAYKQKLVDGDRVPFAREEAVDSCGNEMLMSIASPHVLQEVFDGGPQDLEIWPTSCPDGADCQTAAQGNWDVGMTQMRSDGFVDMVINVFPGLETDPIQPGLWGHFSGFFLTENNPGTPWISLFANVRRVQVNLLSLWQLDRAYVDPMGVREVFRFPHRARTLSQADVLVFLEGYSQTEGYWAASGLGESTLPYGAQEEAQILIDQTAPIGETLARQAGEDTTILTTLNEIFAYQIATAISCPTIREAGYRREGPVEFFFCPEIDIGTCIAQEDMEEAACIYETEPVFDPFNPLVAPVEFPRVLVDSVGQSVVVPEAKLPTYLSSIADLVSVQVDLTVTESSVLYMYDPEHITAAVSGTGLPVVLPPAVANTHCTDSEVQRFDIGAAWGPGTYTVTVDYAAGDGVIEETDLLGATRYNLWMHFTSIPTWTPPG